VFIIYTFGVLLDEFAAARENGWLGEYWRDLLLTPKCTLPTPGTSLTSLS
jgi:hypothetical protein